MNAGLVPARGIHAPGGGASAGTGGKDGGGAGQALVAGQPQGAAPGFVVPKPAIGERLIVAIECKVSEAIVKDETFSTKHYEMRVMRSGNYT